MKKILVVDDEESILLLYQEELKDAGYQVMIARDGKEALEKVKQDKPDLITLDLKMAHMDGAEFLQALRELHRDLPVIISTAYPDYRQDFRLWASNGFVTKSSDLMELKAKISEILGQSA